LIDTGIHVVLVDRKLPGLPADTVVADNLSGAMQAVEHLLAGGYRRIACIAGPLATTTGSERLLGYRMALERAGMAADDSLVRVADYREQGGAKPCKNCSNMNRPPMPSLYPTTG
jgi:LacI family transcriptional regulator